jgi:hypothetical protein
MSLWDVFRGMDQACLQAFGADLVFMPQAGEQVAIRGIFQPVREPEDAAPGVYAVLFVRLDDFPDPPVRGDEFEIQGSRYKIWDIEADTGGTAVLRLRRV